MFRLFVVGLSLCLGCVTFAIDVNVLDSDPLQKQIEERRDALGISRYYENYFISGRPDTKVQFSFKLQVIDRWNLYLGYTQVMFWDLFIKDSSPFSDVNYNPDLFYRWYMNNGILKGIDLGILEHRSNGRDGTASRSWNRNYINFRTEFRTFDFKSRWETKIFYLYDLDTTNADIRTTLGYVETSYFISSLLPRMFNEDELQIRFAPGGDFNVRTHGYQEISYKFRLPITRLNPFFYIQFHNGVNESLILYNEYHTSYRIGLAL